jgi:hypothetical protein
MEVVQEEGKVPHLNPHVWINKVEIQSIIDSLDFYLIDFLR